MQFQSLEALGTGDFECTVCRERKALTPFEKRTDSDAAIYDLWLCLMCGAILNATHLRLAQGSNAQDEAQASTSDEFYRMDDLASVPQAIDADGFTDFLFAQCPDLERGVALDFGAGRGITAAAAAKVFSRVYAADLTLTTLSLVHGAMPQRDRVTLTSDYRSIPGKLDAIYAMHAIEHLPNMRDFLDDFADRLAPGGALFFQVPMLRKDHLVCVHYTFLTEMSCRAMARGLRMDLIGVWFDNDNDFLTCIMRKPIPERRGFLRRK